ncbi:MAG: hypothetical protein WCS62_04550 [Bacilli bacterium]
MKLVHVLGHNPNWNTEIYSEQNVGDEFLISAFNFGERYLENKRVVEVIDQSMIDLQFYGQKKSGELKKGHLSDFPFHTANIPIHSEPTNLEINRCIINAIEYQVSSGFTKIVIPHFYEDTFTSGIISTVNYVNKYLKKNKEYDKEYFMTLPLANDIIRNQDDVEQLLVALTDMDICFDGYFIVCENKVEQGRKITNDMKLITNLSRVFKVLKNQGFQTIYAYANWDALFYLAQTEIDYITIGTYENLRNFSIKRFTEDISGGASLGYYFSEQLLNMVRARDLEIIRVSGMLKYIENSRNIFSDVILKEGYRWNIHKPDVNKNYLLSISRLLKNIASITSIRERTLFTLNQIENAIKKYEKLEENYVTLQSESQNYHLDAWRLHLLKTISMKPNEFRELYSHTH